jgi:hypothetical protein
MSRPFDRQAALDDIDEVVEWKPPTGGTGGAMAYVARAVACLLRHAPISSTYGEGAKRAETMPDRGTASQLVWGLLTGLRVDIDKGKQERFEESVRGDVFSDFLSQAEYLVTEDANYRRAAAVLGGGTLEEHMRKLATKHTIAIVNGQGAPKKASQINADLYAANVYGKPDHALVDAWLKLRNEAAHGEGDFEKNHSAEKVANMLSGIRELIARLPA